MVAAISRLGGPPAPTPSQRLLRAELEGDACGAPCPHDVLKATRGGSAAPKSLRWARRSEMGLDVIWACTNTMEMFARLC